MPAVRVMNGTLYAVFLSPEFRRSDFTGGKRSLTKRLIFGTETHERWKHLHNIIFEFTPLSLSQNPISMRLQRPLQPLTGNILEEANKNKVKAVGE